MGTRTTSKQNKTIYIHTRSYALAIAGASLPPKIPRESPGDHPGIQGFGAKKDSSGTQHTSFYLISKASFIICLQRFTLLNVLRLEQIRAEPTKSTLSPKSICRGGPQAPGTSQGLPGDTPRTYCDGLGPPEDPQDAWTPSRIHISTN